MNHNQQHQQQARAEALRDKFQDKPHHEEWQSVRYVALAASVVLQLITAACAVAGPAYLVKMLFGSWPAGLFVGCIVMVLFEFSKRSIVSIKMKQLVKSHRLGAFSWAALVAVSGLSILSSFLGTPLLVQELALQPSEAMEAVTAPIREKRDQAVAQLKAQQKEAKQAAKELKAAASTSDGQLYHNSSGAVAAMTLQASSFSDSIAKIEAFYREKEEQAISEASATLQAEKETKEAQVETAGIVFSLVCLFFEVLFIFCSWWLQDYDWKEYLYIEQGGAVQSNYQAPPHRPAANQRQPMDLDLGISADFEDDFLSDSSEDF